MSRPFEQPDYPSDEEVEALRAFTEQAVAQGDALRRGEPQDSVQDPEDSEEGAGTRRPAVSARTYAYIPRSVSPARWSRKTRWGNGTRRLPSPPSEANEHVRRQWVWILARVMEEGWQFSRSHVKQEPAWYVDFAKLLAREAAVAHVARCPKGCEEEEWLWLLSRTDKTPVLDATPYPEPYERKHP